MKRLLLSLLFVVAAICMSLSAVSAGKEDIVWDNTTHDFGTIHASAGKVKAEYTFVNNSPSAVAIISVTNGGCGCTVPAFPKKPVAAGEKGTVTITFDPARFKGEFKRQVTVTIMAGSKRVKAKLKFSGHIIPE